MKKSGFVSISGQPNVGKSTLLNSLMREKVAIISKRPETTRDNIRGILTLEDAQIIFVDTPGIHKPHDLLGKLMLTRAQSSLMESDIVLFMTEKKLAFNAEDMSIVSRLPDPEEGKPVFLIINKADRIKKKEMVLPLIQKAEKIYPFKEIIPMCSLNKQHVEDLLKTIISYLPEGEFLYPEDQLTDKSEAFMIQEIIREKVLTETYAEVPHSAAVMIDQMEEDKKSGCLKIFATIFVERDSQKAIIIGKNGEKMKEIGRKARLEIEKLLDRHVYLELWVKVFEKWKKNPRGLAEMGYVD